jgi:N-acetylglucosaminyldiphosphoundecaprenol N-acetyl-beta-D-mannosaminyltransferase
MPIEATPFLGLAFADETLESATGWVTANLTNGGFRYVVTPNVDHIVRLDRQKGTLRGDELTQAYRIADLCLCDSRVLSRLAKLFGHRLAVVPGSDLTAHILANVDPNTGIAVVGGDPAAVEDLKRRYKLSDVRHHGPPMGMLDNPGAMTAAVDFVHDAKGRLIFLAVGSPQSEILAFRAKQQGTSGVALCIGASIDFLTGRQTRAPLWMQRTGFEWAYRLLSEPKRMWRRYLVEGPRILWIAVRRHHNQ